MLYIAVICKVALKPAHTYRFQHGGICRAGKKDAQLGGKIALCGSLLSNCLPKQIRIGILREEACMDNVKITLLQLCAGQIEVALVKAIGNKLHPCRGHSSEVSLHLRRDNHNSVAAIQHLLLQILVFRLCISAKMKVFEIENLCPRVSEICNPPYACGSAHPLCYKMHRVGRTGADNGIYRMGFEIFYKEAGGWPYPEKAWVWYEEVPPYEYGEPLHQRLGLLCNNVGLYGSAALFSCQALVEPIGLHYLALENRNGG